MTPIYDELLKQRYFLAAQQGFEERMGFLRDMDDATRPIIRWPGDPLIKGIRQDFGSGYSRGGW